MIVHTIGATGYFARLLIVSKFGRTKNIVMIVTNNDEITTIIIFEMLIINNCNKILNKRCVVLKHFRKIIFIMSNIKTQIYGNIPACTPTANQEIINGACVDKCGANQVRDSSGTCNYCYLIDNAAKPVYKNGVCTECLGTWDSEKKECITKPTGSGTGSGDGTKVGGGKKQEAKTEESSSNMTWYLVGGGCAVAVIIIAIIVMRSRST